MCKTRVIDFSLLKPNKVHGLLKNFPACKVRYQTDSTGYGLVLVHPAVKDQSLVKQKIAAAKIKADKEVYVVDIPDAVVRRLGI